MKKYLVMMALVLLACSVGFVPVTALASDEVAASVTIDMVHINQATAEQFQVLPGVGPALSERIVAYREAQGPFKNVDQLAEVKGIGERKLEKFRAFLVVD